MAAKKESPYKWVRKATIMTFFIACAMNFISSGLLKQVNMFFAMIILLVIILIGVLFDILGMAVAAADAKPFHSMASKRIPSARYSIGLIRHASAVSNICNDVIGDISGVISGGAVALIISQVNPTAGDGLVDTATAVAMTSMVAAVTVGGKAYGKHVAIGKWKDIVHVAGVILYRMDHHLKIRFFKD